MGINKGEIALITGASAGIGRATALAFANAGADIMILGRRKEKLEELAIEIKSKYKVGVQIFQCDVRNRNEVEAVRDELQKNNFDKLHYLINNAGLARGQEKFTETLYEDWEEMIDTNIKGLLYVSKTFLPFMIKNNGGTVINIGSIAGEYAYPGGNVYCGTKAFVKIVSEAMNIDLNGTGVRVTNIEPGLVETEFSFVRYHGDEERAKNVYKNMKALRGEDIADCAVYAASCPKHVNIQNMLVTPTAQANAYTVFRG